MKYCQLNISKKLNFNKLTVHSNTYDHPQDTSISDMQGIIPIFFESEQPGDQAVMKGRGVKGGQIRGGQKEGFKSKGPLMNNLDVAGYYVISSHGGRPV